MDKPIKLTSQEQVEEQIQKVQAKARERKITYTDIQRAVTAIETRLDDLKVFKKDRIGMRFYIDPNAQTFPNAYNGIPESTNVSLEITATGWKINSIERTRCTAKRILFENEADYTQFFTF